MSDTIEIEIKGLEQLRAKLKSVSDDVQFKGGRFALRKAANLIANKVKESAKTIDDPKSAADISKNVAVRWSGRYFKRTGDLKFRVGILGGAGGSAKASSFEKFPGKDTRHWRFIEFGTKKMRAQPFMLPSLRNNISPATNEFVVQYGKAIDRAIKRAKK